MQTLIYHDFILRIRRHNKKYIAYVSQAHSTEAQEEFTLPFTAPEIEDFILGIHPRSAHPNSRNNETAVKEFGDKLYRSIFKGKIASRLDSSIALAKKESEKDKVRIRLLLSETPELACLPWEFLYDKLQNRFLALSRDTTVMRNLDIPTGLNPLKTTAPLKVLVMISCPKDSIGLNVEAEWENLHNTFNQLPAGLVQVTELAQASLKELEAQLSRDQYHIFHYIGHGSFHGDEKKYFLSLENEKGFSEPIEGEKLGVFLHNHHSLRLVVLNTCESARTTTHNIYAGIAQGLIQSQIPAVIAMQFEISDQAALAFSRRFYQATAQGKAIDVSFDEARRAIYAEQKGGSEWGTPVLYLHTENGNLFDLTAQPLQTTTPATKAQQPPPGSPVALSGSAPTGTLPRDCPVYIEREIEKEALNLITNNALTLVILAPGQCGGSTLLHRLLATAEKNSRRSIYLDFQDIFNIDEIADKHIFYRAFCTELTNLIGFEGHEERVEYHWREYGNATPQRICTAYIQSLLKSLNDENLFLVLDEVDLLFDTPLKSDFFAMLRSWHNSRASRPEFRRLSFVFVTSVDRGLLIDGSYQSGFNVGEVIYLTDFEDKDIRNLSTLHNLQLKDSHIRELMHWLGGHPSLHQLALHHIRKTVDELLAQSSNPALPATDAFIRQSDDIIQTAVDQLLLRAKAGDSLFRPHLESHYANLRRNPPLLQGIEAVMKNRQPEENIIMQLRRAGLIYREGNKVQFRCRLYETYFRKQFRLL
jgi:hypothetical protein